MVYPHPQKYRISSSYASHVNNKRVPGVDIATPMNTPVYAPESGVIEVAGKDKYGGVFYRLRANSGRLWIPVHFAILTIKAGQRVAEGEYIGRTGNSGNSTGPHTHYSVKENGRYINPTELLQNAPLLNIKDNDALMAFEKLTEDTKKWFTLGRPDIADYMKKGGDMDAWFSFDGYTDSAAKLGEQGRWDVIKFFIDGGDAAHWFNSYGRKSFPNGLLNQPRPNMGVVNLNPEAEKLIKDINTSTSNFLKKLK